MDKDFYKDLAEPLLADAFWSEWEYLDAEELAESDLLILKSEIKSISRRYKYGQEITSGMLRLCSDFEIDLSNILPIDDVKKIEKYLNKRWQGKLTLKELYDIDQQAAHRAVWAMVGFGVSPTDEQHIEDLFKERGIKMPSSCFESPHDRVWDLLVQVESKLCLNYLENFAEESAGNWRDIPRFNFELICDLSDIFSWAVFNLEAFAASNSGDELKDEANIEEIENQLSPLLKDAANKKFPDIFRKVDNKTVMIGIRVVERDNVDKTTDVCELLATLHRAIAVKDVLNHKLYQKKVRKATLENIKEAHYLIHPQDDLPERWDEQVLEWLEKNLPSALESNSEVPEPSGDSIVQALKSLGYYAYNYN